MVAISLISLDSVAQEKVVALSNDRPPLFLGANRTPSARLRFPLSIACSTDFLSETLRSFWGESVFDTRCGGCQDLSLKEQRNGFGRVRTLWPAFYAAGSTPYAGAWGQGRGVIDRKGGRVDPAGGCRLGLCLLSSLDYSRKTKSWEGNISAQGIRVGNQTDFHVHARLSYEFALRPGFAAFKWFSGKGSSRWCDDDTSRAEREVFLRVSRDNRALCRVHAPHPADPTPDSFLLAFVFLAGKRTFALDTEDTCPAV